MSEREQRKRIPSNNQRLLPVEDELAFTRNRCSKKARKINSINHNLIFEIWFDQHYQIRLQFGDENGMRPGIDALKVESLVLRSMKHLVAYSSLLKIFNFINHNLNGDRANRIVLQELTDEGKLNVVIEAHLINLDTYEITVKTAMCIDTFRISEGQFILEIIENESILKKLDNGKIKEIYSL
jgi:hypothetical protein